MICILHSALWIYVHCALCRCALCRCANPWPGPPSCVIVQSSGQNRDTQPQTILHISYIFKQSYTDTNHIFLYCSISFSPNKYFLLLYYQTFLGGLGCSRVLLGFRWEFGCSGGFCLSGSPPRLLHLYVGLGVAATGLVTRVIVAALALKAALRGGSQPQLAIPALALALALAFALAILAP